jgi:hypothetical protein
MSILLTLTSRRGRSWNFWKPSRLARSVTSSSAPVTMTPKCPGGRFFFATGSKSNTSSACFGSVMTLSRSRGAHTIGSGGRAGKPCAKAAKGPAVMSGPVARNCSTRRRLAGRKSCRDMINPLFCQR